MTVSNSREKAQKLIRLGVPVFRVRVDADGTKTPMHENGHLDATLDPGLADDWFAETRGAHVGAYLGPAHLIAADIDVKNDKNGWDSLEENWYTVPKTFDYPTLTGGSHLIYRHPAGLNLAPSSNYRGMPGVDTRAGSSWIVWWGDEVPDSLDAFAPAPEWLLDEKKVKTAEEFAGSLKEWFDTLEPGDPSAVVRKAIERIHDDMGHSEMVSATYEAIRLGAERNAGVADLLAALEEAWLSRDPGNHTTPEDKWEYKFHEALTTGIQKYGQTIGLIRDMPQYSPSLVPDTVPDSWVTGAPGGKTEFNRLLRKLVEVETDDMKVLSILWNAPTTRDISRDWGGVDFIHKRIVEQRGKSTPATAPEQPAEAPTAVEKPRTRTQEGYRLLNPVEREYAEETPTFIDSYVDATDKANGFVQPAYAVPLAWTTLSMAFGTRAVIPRNGVFNVSLWFNVVGFSGTGKSKSVQFADSVLKCMFAGENGKPYFRVEGSSSVEGLTEALAERDNLPTILLQDEAGSFYKELVSSEWRKALPHDLAKWYDGEVIVGQRVSARLKDLRGKRTTTSFNFFTIATPKATLQAMTDKMFESGFAARMNWVIGPEAVKAEERFKSKRSNIDAERGVPDQALTLAWDLLHARFGITTREAAQVWGSPEAVARLDKAHLDMVNAASGHIKYEDVIEPSITRLDETAWKCAALLALYRGDTEFTLEDATIALSYVEQWFSNIISVSEQVVGEYERDLNVICDIIRSQGGRISRKNLLNRLRGMILRNARELSDRIDFLVESGRIQSSLEQGQTHYEVIE